MKIECPLCDFENGEGSRFCKNCNKPLIKCELVKPDPEVFFR